MINKLKWPVLILILLIVAYFGVVTWNKQRAQNTSKTTYQEQTQQQSSQQTTKPQVKYPDIPNDAVYKSKDGYIFEYPSSLFKPIKKSITVPTAAKKPGEPNGKQTITVDAFKHEIQTEHCALSGVCTPTTIDMSFGSFMRNEDFKPENYPEIQWEPYKFPDGTISSIQTYSEGVEGEGMFYTFIPYSDTKTIIFFRTYINESILSKYQTVPDFLPLEQQKLIYESIIGSLD